MSEFDTTEPTEGPGAPERVPEATDGASTAPGAPRKRGKPKGLPKSGGRQKGTTNWTSETVRAELLPKAMRAVVDILDGKAIQTTATTGKPIWKRPSHAEILRAAELALAKCLPDLASTELTGAAGSALYPNPIDADANPREVARAVLSLLREAEIDGSTNHIGIAGPGESLLRVTDPDLAARVLPDSGGTDAQVSESEVFDNGATIQLVEIPTGRNPKADLTTTPLLKWEVRDKHGELHSMKRERSDAETLARALP